MRAALRFQSAPPVRGATMAMPTRDTDALVSIRAPRERGDGIFRVSSSSTRVSIRAPRERGDYARIRHNPTSHRFNPRPP